MSQNRVTQGLHDVRNDLLTLRRAIRPHRDALNSLVRDESPLVTHDTRVFLRDCYDHTVQLMDMVEAYRDLCSDVRDYYMATVSNRMNEVMKVLTIVSTTFIPLGFVAGLYGMNFQYSITLEYAGAELAVWISPRLTPDGIDRPGAVDLLSSQALDWQRSASRHVHVTTCARQLLRFSQMGDRSGAAPRPFTLGHNRACRLSI